jgi:hypothetical protein
VGNGSGLAFRTLPHGHPVPDGGQIEAARGLMRQPAAQHGAGGASRREQLVAPPVLDGDAGGQKVRRQAGELGLKKRRPSEIGQVWMQ